MDRKRNNSNDSFEEYETDIEYDDDELKESTLYNEEIATEIIDEAPLETNDNDTDQDMTNNVYAWIALGLSLLSFFIMPYVFAGAAIILGFIARNRERVILGNTAIVIGIVSIVVRFLVF